MPTHTGTFARSATGWPPIAMMGRRPCSQCCGLGRRGAAPLSTIPTRSCTTPSLPRGRLGVRQRTIILLTGALEALWTAHVDTRVRDTSELGPFAALGVRRRALDERLKLADA